MINRGGKNVQKAVKDIRFYLPKMPKFYPGFERINNAQEKKTLTNKL